MIIDGNTNADNSAVPVLAATEAASAKLAKRQTHIST